MDKKFSYLKYLYKYSVQYFFKLIYGKVIYKNSLKISIKDSIKKIHSNSIRKLNGDYYYVYNISNGRIFTDYVENVAIINKNNILSNSSYQQVAGRLKNAKFNSVLYKGTPRFKKKIDGNVLSLIQGASGHSNYFHWLFDILPRINLFSSIYNLKKIDYLYLSEIKNFQSRSLKILNLDKIKIIDANKYRHISANKIFAVDHPWYHGGYILNQAKNLPEWVIKWIRHSFLKSSSKFNNNDKIFIDRSESKFDHCQLDNNDEVWSFLKNKGFTKYKVGELTFEQQIYLFKKAKIIVGAHGAAFANLVFCSPNTKVIEIKPRAHPNYVSRTFAKINNLNLKIIETQKVQKKKQIKGDIHLSLKELSKNLYL